MIFEKFRFVDLFCGIGGFHQAMSSLGGECVFACDIDEACRELYRKNYGITPAGDIKKVAAEDIPEHEVLCGGFPCQAFSIAGKRLGFGDPTKGTLFFDIMRIVHHHHPKYILLENVRNLATHDHGNTWKIIHQSLLDAGYNVSETPIIFSPHYIGIPQHRERVFIMAVRKDIGELPEFFYNRKKAKPCTIYPILQDDSEIKNIHKYQMKKYDIAIVDHWNRFLAGIRGKVKKLPCFPVSDLFLFPDLERFDIVNMHPEKAMFARRNVELFNAAPAFITRWLGEAYKLPKFRGSKRMLEWHAGNVENPDLWETILQFRQSGIRARAANHFPTLTAVAQTPVIGRRRRKLTPRECARLQSFPDSFICDPVDHEAYKQFGNSVNVEVVKLFARFLLGDEEVHNTYRKTEEDILAEMPKKRGRPRKDDPTRPKPKIGRPRKYPTADSSVQQVKRKRGRPRKNPMPADAAEGRPQVIEFSAPSLFSDEELHNTIFNNEYQQVVSLDVSRIGSQSEAANDDEMTLFDPQLDVEDPHADIEAVDETYVDAVDLAEADMDTPEIDIDEVLEAYEQASDLILEEEEELIDALTHEVETVRTDDVDEDDLEYWLAERLRLEQFNKQMLAEENEQRAILRANGYRDPNKPKGKRGRPRKYPLPVDADGNPIERRPRKKKDASSTPLLADGTTPPKRKRGRPRKIRPEE